MMPKPTDSELLDRLEREHRSPASMMVSVDVNRKETDGFSVAEVVVRLPTLDAWVCIAMGFRIREVLADAFKKLDAARRDRDDQREIDRAIEALSIPDDYVLPAPAN